MDVGQSLNPAIDIGQIEGAFVHGYGLFVQEELRYSTDGTLLTKGPHNYMIPAVSNIPVQFNVSLLKGSKNMKAVYSSKVCMIFILHFVKITKVKMLDENSNVFY